MFSRFARIRPYLRANRKTLGLGLVALVIANYLDVRLLIRLGQLTDALTGRVSERSSASLLAPRELLGLIFLTIAFAAIARFWMRKLIIGMSREVEYSFRNDLFAHLQKLSPSFYEKYPTGDLMARSTNDLEAVRLVIGPALMYLTSVSVMLPISLVAMVSLSGKLTLATFVPLLMLAPVFYFFSSRIHVRFMKVQETFSSVTSRVQEIVAGIRVLKAYAREDQEADRFADLSNEYVHDNIELTKIQAFFLPMMTLIVGTSLIAVIWGGGRLMISGELSEGPLISFFLLMQANIWPLAAVGWVFSLVERGAASMKRLDKLFEAEPDIVSGGASVPPRAVAGLEIEIRDLSFTYPRASTPSLNNLSVRLEPGHTLGLTGPVGCGKSTLAMLLARRYNPPRGSILIDGIDILDWPLDVYRSRISIVDQEPFVFSDTIGANIGYALNGRTNGRVAEVSDIAKISGEIEALPAGYDTLLGERGINLSGGQRQRTALARALAVDPQLLILDDALAAVDTHTEEQILSGLHKFMANRTTILISHRIRTVSVADQILYLKDGLVEDSGTHEELMSREGEYWKLAQQQRIAEEIEETA